MTKHQFIRMSSILLTVAVLFLGLAGQTQAAALTATSSSMQQRQIDPEIHVALTPGGPQKYVIASMLSLPPAQITTVIVTYHGSTYGQYYWNFPYKPGTYSFVDAMTKAGYAVKKKTNLFNNYGKVIFQTCKRGSELTSVRQLA